MTEWISMYMPQLGVAGVILLFLLQLFFNWRTKNNLDNSQQINVDAFNTFNKALTARVDKLEEEVASLRAENVRLSKENERLKTKLVIMESAHQDAPIPMWLKDKDGVMLAVNKAYEDEFLTPIGKTIDNYLGKTDFDVWPDNIAMGFVGNDKLVESTRKVWMGTELVHTPDGAKLYAIMKYPRMEGNYLIGVAGIGVPHEMMQKLISDHQTE